MPTSFFCRPFFAARGLDGFAQLRNWNDVAADKPFRDGCAQEGTGIIRGETAGPSAGAGAPLAHIGDAVVCHGL